MNTLLSTHLLNVSIADKLVCKDLGFSIRSNECWAILGTNGIGKTTLLHTLAGLRPANSGEIHYLDQQINLISKRQLAKTRAVLFQDQRDPFPATVTETVAIGRHPYLSTWQWSSRQDNQVIQDALERVNMQKFSDRVITSLSGGERQRVSIATVLAQTPQLYLLDEPTSHLDLPHQMKMLALLSKQKNASTSVVMILHDVNLAARFCDYALMLFGNGEVKTGTTTDLMNPDTLSQLYGYPIRQVNGNGPGYFLPE